MGRDLLSPWRAHTLLAATVAVTLLLDQLSKAVVRAIMQPGHTIPLIDGVFHLTHVRNSGAAFGLMPGRQSMFVAVSAAVLLGIVGYVWRSRSFPHIIAVSLGLVAGGSLGNLIDRLVSGRVTDFLDFQVWPVFNVADSAIFLGVGGLVWWSLAQSRREAEVSAGPTEET